MTTDTGRTALLVTDSHRLLLETIYNVFLETEAWPSFGWLEDDLDRRGIDIRETLRTIPQGLYWPEWRPSGVVYYREEAQLGLRIAGLALCSHSEQHLQMRGCPARRGFLVTAVPVVFRR